MNLSDMGKTGDKHVGMCIKDNINKDFVFIKWLII